MIPSIAVRGVHPINSCTVIAFTVPYGIIMDEYEAQMCYFP